MGKLLFPMPGRRPSAQSASMTFESSVLEGLDSPTTGHFIPDSPAPSTNTKMSRKSSRRSLKKHDNHRTVEKKPSYMSIELSTIGSGDLGEPVSAPPTGPLPPIPKVPQGLMQRSSSPLLGQRYQNNTLPVAGMHDSGSTSTLQSYYDPAKLPLSISQQTSASSARDMSLRKGLPKMFSRSQSGSNPSTPTTPTDNHLQREDDDVSAETVNGKKKPARLDLSALFPKPAQMEPPDDVLLSPSRMSASPKPLSMMSRLSPHFAPRDWKFKRAAKGAKEPSTESNELILERKVPGSPISFKLDTFQVKPSIQNWFETLDENAPSSRDGIPDSRQARKLQKLAGEIPPMDDIINGDSAKPSKLERLTGERTPVPKSENRQNEGASLGSPSEISPKQRSRQSRSRDSNFRRLTGSVPQSDGWQGDVESAFDSLDGAFPAPGRNQGYLNFPTPEPLTSKKLPTERSATDSTRKSAAPMPQARNPQSLPTSKLKGEKQALAHGEPSNNGQRRRIDRSAGVANWPGLPKMTAAPTGPLPPLPPQALQQEPRKPSKLERLAGMGVPSAKMENEEVLDWPSVPRLPKGPPVLLPPVSAKVPKQEKRRPSKMKQLIGDVSSPGEFSDNTFNGPSVVPEIPDSYSSMPPKHMTAKRDQPSKMERLTGGLQGPLLDVQPEVRKLSKLERLTGETLPGESHEEATTSQPKAVVNKPPPKKHKTPSLRLHRHKKHIVEEAFDNVRLKTEFASSRKSTEPRKGSKLFQLTGAGSMHVDAAFYDSDVRNGSKTPRPLEKDMELPPSQAPPPSRKMSKIFQLTGSKSNNDQSHKSDDKLRRRVSSAKSERWLQEKKSRETFDSRRPNVPEDMPTQRRSISQQRGPSRAPSINSMKSQPQLRSRFCAYTDPLSPVLDNPSDNRLRAAPKDWESRSAASIRSAKTTASRKSKSSNLFNTAHNVNDTSILMLSSDSSESENEDEVDVGAREADVVSKGTRSKSGSVSQSLTESIVDTDTEEDVKIYVAKTAMRTSVTQQTLHRIYATNRSSTALHSGMDSDLAVDLSRSASKRMSSATNQTTPSEHTIVSQRSMSRLSQSSHDTSVRSHGDDEMRSPRRGRLMAVTEEEESLLEAMREKRARMRQNELEGYKNTMKNDSRNTLSSHSGLSPERGQPFDGEGSLSPPRDSYPPRISSLNEFNLPFNAPRPPSSTDPSVENSIRYIAASSKGSIRNSGSLPSPEPSPATPLTPPIHEYESRSSSRKDEQHASYDRILDGPADNKTHGRTRTASSSIVVMDTPIKRPSVAAVTTEDVLDEFPAWARNY